MELFQARRQSDTTADIDIGSSEYARFIESVQTDCPISFKDRNWEGERKKWTILAAEVAGGGKMTFYLKRYYEKTIVS